MNCPGCGSQLLTIVAKRDGLCHVCTSKQRALVSHLADVDDVDLVEELLSRGWDASQRVRNNHVRVILLEPLPKPSEEDKP